MGAGVVALDWRGVWFGCPACSPGLASHLVPEVTPLPNHSTRAAIPSDPPTAPQGPTATASVHHIPRATQLAWGPTTIWSCSCPTTSFQSATTGRGFPTNETCPARYSEVTTADRQHTDQCTCSHQPSDTATTLCNRILKYAVISSNRNTHHTKPYPIVTSRHSARR